MLSVGVAKLQNLLAVSTTEVEYVTAVEEAMALQSAY